MVAFQCQESQMFLFVFPLTLTPRDRNPNPPGSLDRTVRFWTAEGSPIWVSEQTPQSKGFNCVSVSPDGQRVAGGSDDCRIHLWGTSTGELQVVMSGHGAWVYSLSWSPDSCVLASASRDRSVRLWDVTTSESLQHSLSLHARRLHQQEEHDDEGLTPREAGQEERTTDGDSVAQSPGGGIRERANAFFAFGKQVKSKMVHAIEEKFEHVGETLGDRFEILGDLAESAQV
jgi:hypothetical protein